MGLKTIRRALAAIVAGACLVFILASYGSSSGSYRFHSVLAVALSSTAVLFLLPGSRKWRPLSPTLTILFSALSLWGVLLVINAHADHSMANWTFTEFEARLFEAAPGTMTYSTSKYAVFELFVVFLSTFAIGRTTKTNTWRSYLALCLLTGILVTLTGLGHKIMGLETVWGFEDSQPPTFFAPFIYNANAAAYLNLTIPLALGFFCYQRRRGGSDSLMSLYLLAAGLIMVGSISAASKAGIAILIICLVLFLVLEWRSITFKRQSFSSGTTSLESRAVKSALAIAAVISAIAVMSLAISRFTELAGRVSEGGSGALIPGRIAMIKKMAAMAGPQEGSWHGFGPGSFPHIFPYFNAENEIAGTWLQGHSDPMQTLVEWGWLGALLWFSIGIGAVCRGFVLLRQIPEGSPERPLISAVIVSLLGVGLHSLIDFPLSIFSIHFVSVSLCALLWCLQPRYLKRF